MKGGRWREGEKGRVEKRDDWEGRKGGRRRGMEGRRGLRKGGWRGGIGG